MIGRQLPRNRVLFLMAAVVALSVGTLIALQPLISPTVAFSGLVIGGVALGLSGTDMQKTATYALLAGLFAYFLVSVASASPSSIHSTFRYLNRSRSVMPSRRPSAMQTRYASISVGASG